MSRNLRKETSQKQYPAELLTPVTPKWPQVELLTHNFFRKTILYDPWLTFDPMVIMVELEFLL